MTVSTSFDFTLTRDQIITQMLRTIGVLADGENATADQITDGSFRLNLMMKAWRNKGISLPLYQDVVVFLEEGETQYLVGPSGDKTSTSAYVKTELSAAALSGATTITVDSIAGFFSGNVIGVEQDDNTIHWTTINGSPSGSTITLTAATTADAAIDNHVYNALAGIVQRPIKVVDARLKREDGNEVPVRVVTRQEYFGYTNKTAQGSIVAVYYDPQLTNGVLYVYNTANNVADTLHLTVQRQVADLDLSSDNADFPVEWLEAIIYGLADRSLTKYGIDQVTAALIKSDAAMYLQDAEDFDMEGSFSFAPAVEGYED